ncbi:MAG: hypothetical protein AAGA58_08100 [Verrucomicrobiota bacterium]
MKSPDSRIPFLSCLTVIIVASSISMSQAVTIVLDDNNNRVATIATGLQIQQANWPAAGTWSLVGGDFALGAPDIADFSSSFTSAGQSGGGGAGSPASFVNNATVFTIRDLGTGDLYEAMMTYYRAPMGGNSGGVGTAPVPSNGASAVFEVTLIPEPSVSLLGILAASAMVVRRRRR